MVERDNRKDFIEGCRALHDMFTRFAEASPGRSEKGSKRKWGDIRPVVRRIIAFEGKKDERSRQWIDALANGDITGRREQTLDYLGERWTELAEDMRQHPAQAPEPGVLVKTDIHLFYRAARWHRNLVISDILPEHGILAA